MEQGMTDKRFRFQDFDIWQKAAGLSSKLFDMADQLEQKHKFKFAEQLRAATLSITNNIAEGSGSRSDVDFANFLNISRRSVFEVANILILMARYNALDDKEICPVLDELQDVSKMILAFMRSLSK
jgi:four helix bundle protein